jgi:hypothetical protein
MEEVAILDLLGRSPQEATLILLKKPSHWSSTQGVLVVPRKLVAASRTKRTLVLALPRKGACDVFVVDRETLLSGRKVLVESRKRHHGSIRMLLISCPKGPIVAGWRYLPFPTMPLRHHVPDSFNLDVQTLQRFLAQSMQATAEWLLYDQQKLHDPKTAAKLLRQYSQSPLEHVDALFAALLLPYTKHVRIPANKRLAHTAIAGRENNHFPAETVTTVSWQDLLMSRGVKAWLHAGWVMAEAFATSNSSGRPEILESARRTALRKHIEYFQHRLPSTALEWARRALAPSAEEEESPLLTELCGGGSRFARDFRSMRADVARYAIVAASRRFERPEMNPLLWAVAPCIGTWDACLGNWANLAQVAARHSALPLIQRRVVTEVFVETEAAHQRRAAVVRYYRDHGLWLRPQHGGERSQRLASVEASTLERIGLLFSSNDAAWTPPCITALIARGRQFHHLVYRDRCTLADWLVALQPLEWTTGAEYPERLQWLAQFALGTDEFTDAVDEFVTTLSYAVAGRAGQESQFEDKKMRFSGPACKAIIDWTLSPPDPRYACRCPYAGLAQPDPGASRGLDARPCAAACADSAAAREGSGAKVPITYHPLDRLLWAKETGQAASLDW